MVDKEVVCLYCEPVAATPTETYASCHIMAFLYGGALRGNYSCIKIEVLSNAKEFTSMNGVSCNL